MCVKCVSSAKTPTFLYYLYTDILYTDGKDESVKRHSGSDTDIKKSLAEIHVKVFHFHCSKQRTYRLTSVQPVFRSLVRPIRTSWGIILVCKIQNHQRVRRFVRAQQTLRKTGV